MHLIPRRFRSDVGDVLRELCVALHVGAHVFVVRQHTELAVLGAVDHILEIMEHQKQRMLLRDGGVLILRLVGIEAVDRLRVERFRV